MRRANRKTTADHHGTHGSSMLEFLSVVCIYIYIFIFFIGENTDLY